MGIRRFNMFIESSILQLLFPGLGHIYLGEYSFGVFVLLVMLLAAILAVALLFVSISLWLSLILLSFPAAFYLFSFVDLRKTSNRPNRRNNSLVRFFFFASVGMCYQIVAPSSLLSAFWNNRPHVVIAEQSYAPPTLSKGEWFLVDPVAYVIEMAYLSNPLMHHFPERYDCVYVERSDGNRAVAFVLGYPGEQIEITDSLLIVNGVVNMEIPPHGLALTGEWTLTTVEVNSMLVALPYLGRIDALDVISIDRLKGKVRRIVR